MFASHVSPSPTRTSIKEANDHLLLLHNRVIELEKTVQDQAEALIRKDEQMQARVKEISRAKDAEIHNLTTELEVATERLKKLEHNVQDKDAQLEYLTQRYTIAEEIVALTPSMEKLLDSMKKLPCKNNVVRYTSASSRPKSRSAASTRSHNPKHEKRKSSTDGANSRDGLDSLSVASQSCTDLRIGNSFSINSNFSMSEDEAENGKF